MRNVRFLTHMRNERYAHTFFLKFNKMIKCQVDKDYRNISYMLHEYEKIKKNVRLMWRYLKENLSQYIS